MKRSRFSKRHTRSRSKVKIPHTGSKSKGAGPRKGRLSPRTMEEYSSTSTRFQSQWDRIVGVVTKMRSDGVSLQSAARQFDITPKTVKRWAGSAIRRNTSGKWVARKTDRLLRVMLIPESAGMREIGIRDSRQASTLSRYFNALHHYLEAGDRRALEKFVGKHIRDALGNEVPLLTDFDSLKRLGSAGSLSFESIYGKGA